MVSISTQFAPAERTFKNDLLSDYQFIRNIPLLTEFLDTLPSFLVILNEKRQVVYANRSVREAFEDPDSPLLLGKRAGEIMECLHADETEGGCGTTGFCRYCGSIQTILSSLKGKESVQECRISLQDGNALDFRVWATPKHFNGKIYSVVVFEDISHEKRRQVLERIFFHDVINRASGIHGLLEVLTELEGEEMKEMLVFAQTATQNLVEEINAQRLMAAVENNELKVRQELVVSTSLLAEVQLMYANHEVARNREIIIDPNAKTSILVTDPTLVKRVLGNMLKNALESTSSNLTVSLGCEDRDDEVIFWVHNPGHISEDVQFQLFQRSFSTKGPGRGLGTYSMKLLTERYLAGKISFTSRLDEGTTFRVQLPRGGIPED